MGIQTPIIRTGDNLSKITIDSILRNTHFENGDIVGITESVVARAQGNYVTVDDIAKETDRLFGKNATLVLVRPIYSRNRFSMILKGIARSARKIYLLMDDFDEVGNPKGVNPWTGVDIEKYYTEICEQENCKCEINPGYSYGLDTTGWLDCRLHGKVVPILKSVKPYLGLKDYFPHKCEWGLLGSNKANEETLKLFPNGELAQKLVEDIQVAVRVKCGVNIDVLVYGDGCFKDPVSGIWEFADPVAAVAYTSGLLGSPNEIKLKAFADDKYKDLSDKELENAIKDEIRKKDTDLKGNMASQGTTPRRYIDLIPSLMDLMSGSGDVGTPVILLRQYRNNYSNA